MLMLALDPGLHECGMAWFREGVLVRAALARNDVAGRGPRAWRGMAKACFSAWRPRGLLDEMAVELPQVYHSGRGKGDPADLLELAGVLGATCDRINAGDYVPYHPARWKGQVPKDIHHERIVDLWLDEREVAAVRLALEGQPEGLWHNVLDAVGLGLHHLKRDR